MEIKVERLEEENSLTFTIKVTDPRHVGFGQLERMMMTIMDVAKQAVQEVPSGDSLKEEILSSIHATKEKAFVRAKNTLVFDINTQLKIKFNPICQEIYNWIYDKQSDSLKTWMQEFDPQRTKYYFDNDKYATGDMDDED